MIKSTSSLLLTLCALSISPAAPPSAKVILSPGAAYADTARSWQGIPGIEQAKNGRLWAAWYSGDVGEGAIGNYVLVSTSAGVGAKWSKPLVIEGPKGTRLGDPLPWIDPKGRLWVFWSQFTGKTGAEPILRSTCAIRTDDPTGAEPQWTEPFLIAPDGILFGKPVVRSDGAWIAPYFVNGQWVKGDEVAGRETGTLISTDEGAGWKWLGGTSIGEKLRNFSEATLAQRRNGSLLMVIRTSAGLRQSTSLDGGKTWAESTPLPGFEKGPSTRACMMKLQSGAFMLVYHDAPPDKTGGYDRSRLTAWLSDDEGRTWPHKLLLDERSRVSYPDAVQAADGRILITYDSGRYQAGEKAVLYSVIREEDIRAGKLSSADAKLKLVVNQCFAYGNHPDLQNEAKVAAAMPPKEKLHLYLLIGQSNMAGRGVMDDAQSVSRLRILKFSPRNAWTPGTEPLHTDKPSIAGAGLGMSFARAMADADPTVTIGLIPCAVGGTPLQRWQKGGDLYQQALQRARLAMKHGTLKGILWHQGEADSSKEEEARSYGARLTQMISDLRTDLGAGQSPFVAGKLGEFLATASKDGRPSFWPVVNEQLAALPKLSPRTAVVESTGLRHKGDGVHFDTGSLRELGRRYAAAMARLLAE